jgi:transaldolase
MDPENSTLTAPKTADELTVKVFADGAELEGCRALAADPLIKGFTTNPTLMHKAGITDYEAFAQDLLEIVMDRPISFEVFTDEHDEMERQARKIAAWGENVYVKIPVTNTRGESTEPLLRALVDAGVQVNVTGLMTLQQVERVADAVAGPTASNISVFAGRIADTGVDPVPVMSQALEVMAEAAPNSELIWASPRELLNVVQADEIGCHIITVTHDLLKKLPLLAKDHDEYSLETVKMFHNDAASAGFEL